MIDRGRLKPDIDSADVIVASVPTLGRSGSERLDRYDPDAFKAILIDEVSHIAILYEKSQVVHRLKHQ